jgi:hypothetical protein
VADALDQLPEDVAALLRPHVEAPQMVLDAIGVQLAGKRDEAKAWRKQTGIEITWMQAEDAYVGIDDANRHEYAGQGWIKSMSRDGPLTAGQMQGQTSEVRSTVFHRLTSRYVDAAVAKLGEILLPADDRAFSFSETPVPELLLAKEDTSQVLHQGLGNAPLTRPLAPGETPPPAPPPPPAAAPAPAAPDGQAPGVPGSPPPLAGPAAPGAAPQQPPQVPVTVRDFAMERIEMARKQAKAAETRIYDWMIETQYRSEVRKVIADAARIGVGVLKGPVPKAKRAMSLSQAPDGGVNIQIQEKIIPAAEWCDPWDIFPDPACGEDIHQGDFVFQRDHMSARQVRGLKRLPGYIPNQIDRVLKEGPDKVLVDADPRDKGDKNKHRYTVWYFYGSLTRDELQAIDTAAGKPLHSSDDGDNPHDQYVIVTLINDSVVRANLNPLDSGSFPFHSMPWQRRGQHWAGVGVAEQMRTPQRVCNAALRALLNNAGKSAGSQLVVDTAAIKPLDGLYNITPDKIWAKTNEGPADIRQSMMAIEIPNVTQQLLEIIQLGERQAEETTSIPLIAQGQSGATTPDTFGAAKLQDNNANQLLRSIGYSFDDHITEPLIRQYYEWLLLDPEVPNYEKGEFNIDAHGSAALVERAIQDQSIAQMASMAVNPAFGIDPKKYTELFMRSKHLNPEALMYTEEEQQRLAAQPPPEAPQVTVAKIQQDTQLKLGVMQQQADQQTTEHEGQIAAAAHSLEVGATQADHQHTQAELMLKAKQLELQRELALMDYASRQKISLDQAKAQLAKTAMQLSTERELNAMNNRHEIRKHVTPQPPKPAVQAPGRAANGQAFSQSNGP